MYLDPDTLVVASVANVFALATALPAIMGVELSPAARASRAALVLQAVGWLALIASGVWPGGTLDWALSTLAMASYSGSNWLLFVALESWLGPRRFKKVLLWSAVALPLGYALTFSSYSVRVGWANLLVAVQLLVVGVAALNPFTRMTGRWRWALAACLFVMSVFTLGRGVLGAFYPDAYPYFTAPHPWNLGSLFVAGVSLVLSAMALLVAWHEEADLLLKEQAITDSLTKVLNRHGWNQAAGTLVTHALRYRQPLALITLDLDFFKRINDTRGHEVGDAALRLFGQMLKQGQRSGDIIARVGGEEFCVLMPQASAASARGFDARLRTALAAASPAQLGFALDFSAGVALMQMPYDSLESLVHRSDQALYAAKAAGRARMVVEGQ